ncbi:two-component system regulatory protein YycI [Paenibacillus sp. HB172176]|uniref:two-component system regulatory protein YycI n=1 Tax=Paenibacillus sp. HB172176 TaxID=2493690 RepID=UPI00143A1731|nr:two-component system regulatory protein YycI [Paenibacillus sp. HB172176]
MDWGRAKSVLIMSFLMLNVLLGYQLWLDIREQLHANPNSAELPPDKISLMQQKRISLAANLPLDTPKLADLTYLLHAGTQESIEPVKLDKSVNSALIFTKKELDKALGDQVPELADYDWDLHSSQDGVFVLHRMVDGLPIFNVKLELYNSNLKITSYKQDRVEQIERGEAKQVLPAAKVVASLIETYLAEGSVITDIQLGYHGQIFDSEKQVSAPSWRVILEDGTVYYVHAISGDVTTDGDEEDADASGVGSAGQPD